MIVQLCTKIYSKKMIVAKYDQCCGSIGAPVLTLKRPKKPTKNSCPKPASRIFWHGIYIPNFDKFCRNIFPIFFEMVFLPKTSVAQSQGLQNPSSHSPDICWKEIGFFPDLETLHIYLFASYDRSPKSGLMNFGGVYLSIDCLMFIVSPPWWWVHWDSLSFGFSTLLDRAKCNLLFPYLLSIHIVNTARLLLTIPCYIKIQQENQKEVVGHSHFLLGTYILSFFLCSNCWSYNDYNVGFTQFHKPFPSGYGSKPWCPNGTHSIIAFEWINGNIPLHRPKK